MIELAKKDKTYLTHCLQQLSSVVALFGRVQRHNGQSRLEQMSCHDTWSERKKLCFNCLRSSTGGLRVQLLRAAGGAGGVAGGGWNPHQLTRKSLQRKPLRQHRLIPATGRRNSYWTSKLQKWTHRTSSEAPLNSCRLLLCTPSSTSARRRWRL